MTDRELMQQALDAMLNFPNDISDEMFESIRVLRARLAQPEPEPVWVEVTTNTGDKFILDSAVEADKIRAARDAGLLVVPLYTAPPQREWQSLTEGETIDLALSAFALPEVSSETREKIHRDLVIAMNDQDSRLMIFAANIEVKMKEKNGTI